MKQSYLVLGPLIQEGVYALLSNQHLKPRATIDSWLARHVGRRVLMEGRMTKARVGPVKVPLRRRLAPPSQLGLSSRVLLVPSLGRATADTRLGHVLSYHRKST